MERLDDLRRDLAKAYKQYRHRLPLREADTGQAFVHECQVYLDGTYYATVEIMPWTSGCSWFSAVGGCFFCALSAGCSFDVSDDVLADQVSAALDRVDLGKVDGLAILPYSSLDSNEFPDYLLLDILAQVQQFPNVKVVILGTRPGYINERSLYSIRRVVPGKEIVVYIGVETRSDFIRRYCMNKGFTWTAFERKVHVLHAHGMRAGAYLLLKPPFLTEKEAIRECQETVRHCTAIGVDVMELRSVEVAEHSIQHFLWDMGLYQPVWFWSVLEVLQGLTESELARVTVVRPEITGLSSNQLVAAYSQCELCHPRIDGLLKGFNETHIVPKYTCDCKKIWENLVNMRKDDLEMRLMRQYPVLIDRLRQVVHPQ